MEPREVVGLLNRYFPIITEIVFDHEGTLEKYIGDAVLAVFGVPRAHEDDPERALRAALREDPDIVLVGEMRDLETTETAIETADVLYVTRVQKERFADLRDYEKVRDYYEITPDLMGRAKEKMALMHPLPRVGEIHYAVDGDPRAAYFRQVQNGMFIRMALLAAVLGKA